MDFYVYIHRRKTDGQIFYVGKGQGKRAWLFKNRNQHWHHVVKKHGYNVEIWSIFSNELQAFEEEKRVIAILKSIMPLVNLTEGGEGVSGYKHDDLSKNKISQANRQRKQSRETRVKISLKNKGRNHPMFGTEHKEETIQKMRLAQQGSKNHKSIPVSIFFLSGEKLNFTTQTEAVKYLRCSKNTLKNWVKDSKTIPQKLNIERIK